MTEQDANIVEKFGVNKVHISNLKAGDTVIYNDALRTVGANSLKLDGFLWLCIFSDASKKFLYRVNIQQFPK